MNECINCEKIFATKSNLNRHKKNYCKKGKNSIEYKFKILEKERNNLVNDKIKLEINNKNKDNKIKLLNNEIKKLKKEVKKLKEIEKDKYRLEGEVKVY